MILVLQQEGGTDGAMLTLAPGARARVGRALECELSLSDPTVSRHHAELATSEDGTWVEVRDLGSANGTRINGAETAAGRAAAGDVVAFGEVLFRVSSGAVPPTVVTPQPSVPDDLPPGTIVRTAPGQPLAEVAALTRLLDLTKRLSGEFVLDRVLTVIVDMVFDLLPVDRVSILLSREAGEMEPVPTVTRSRVGEESAARVPRSILWRALADRAPVLTENPAGDASLRSASVVVQSVRRALCVPLLASADDVLGAIYADDLTHDAPFTQQHIDTLFALAGIAAVSVGKIRYAERGRREAALRAAFERFFAPDVAVAIARQGITGPTGRRRTVTVLFSDIRGFTPLAERIPPDELAAMLTEYFSTMTDAVFAHGGTLDKFIGDGVLAVWGAPAAGPDDSQRAVEAALAMHRAMAGIRTRRESQGLAAFRIGIGIARGEAFVGTLGDKRRLDYTVIGDVVNTASRLAGRADPGETLITDLVRRDLPEHPTLETVPDVELRGKATSVPVYRVATGAEGPDPNV